MLPASRIPVVVIGAGHAGLAASWFLTREGVEHVVFERGEVANSWLTERWESMRLLTPNWQTRLPGMAYDGDDRDGYATAVEVAGFVKRYAESFGAPVITGSPVESVTAAGDGYEVVTPRHRWQARVVVIATGACNQPKLPDLRAPLQQISTIHYRAPEQVEAEGVLVVGASASGVQIAEELASAGRRVTLAVGNHVRMPRTYRGRDVQWWMERSGLLDDRYDEVDDIVRARRVPSPQLIGTPERRSIGLNELASIGVRIVGRLVGLDERRAVFSGSLANMCQLADLKQNRMLDTFDAWARDAGVDGEVDDPHRPEPTRVDPNPPLGLDLEKEGIGAVVWATGYRSDHSWLHLPVFDRKGELIHDGGIVTGAPGVYRLGLTFLRRRKSSFICGIEDDAADITAHLLSYLQAVARKGA
ncbi:MAG: NAD(P)/FAD-dependent oxidoreductase [Actinomycetes bacterium]|jgi:putative flavoprotein involved in K+ transport|nr:MAG: pyridine nucleotide-disulfide oxidoreductase [Actinomycetota bacterium]